MKNQKTDPLKNVKRYEHVAKDDPNRQAKTQRYLMGCYLKELSKGN